MRMGDGAAGAGSRAGRRADADGSRGLKPTLRARRGVVIRAGGRKGKRAREETHRGASDAREGCVGAFERWAASRAEAAVGGVGHGRAGAGAGAVRAR